MLSLNQRVSAKRFAKVVSMASSKEEGEGEGERGGGEGDEEGEGEEISFGRRREEMDDVGERKGAIDVCKAAVGVGMKGVRASITDSLLNEERVLWADTETESRRLKRDRAESAGGVEGKDEDGEELGEREAIEFESGDCDIVDASVIAGSNSKASSPAAVTSSAFALFFFLFFRRLNME